LNGKYNIIATLLFKFISHVGLFQLLS